jgi:uncharacterized protein (TIGR00375 family)
MQQFIADLHLHSRFAQGCSKDLTVENLEKWAKIKGIDILGTGDFTHPEWIKELKETLVEIGESGIFTTTGKQKFMLTTEISLVYTQGGKGRRVHLVVFAPSFDSVEKITQYLLTHGRVDYDGRPIFKIPCWEFTKELKKIDPWIEIIPAHAWTPWFALYGSKSGFDTLEECFKEYTKEIHAIETGISSDIEMNDRIEHLKDVRYVSFSDAHSYWPWRLGREATIFELEEPSYKGIVNAIRTGEGFWGTIEVEPSYGKYHADGHRSCDVVMTPEESNKENGICPVCKKELTIGVWNRVEQLASRPAATEVHSQRFYKVLPLHEILSLVLGKGINTKTVWNEYWAILKAGKHEFEILLETPMEKLLEVTSQEVAEAIIAVREGKVEFTSGYDGVYGKPHFPEHQQAPQQVSEQANNTSSTAMNHSFMDEKREEKSKRKAAGQKGLNDFLG